MLTPTVMLYVNPQASKSLSYLSLTTDTSDSATYTFSGVSIGTATSDRYVHVTVHVYKNNKPGEAITAITIGGVSATINVQRSGGNYSILAIATAAVTSGTTADIVITTNGNANQRCSIGVFTSTGLTTSIAIDTAQNALDPGTDTLTSVANGFCISCGNADGGTASWSGVTERYDSIVEPSTCVTGASGVTTGTTITPSCNFTGISPRVWCAATF